MRGIERRLGEIPMNQIQVSVINMVKLPAGYCKFYGVTKAKNDTFEITTDNPFKNREAVVIEKNTGERKELLNLPFYCELCDGTKVEVSIDSAELYLEPLKQDKSSKNDNIAILEVEKPVFISGHLIMKSDGTFKRAPKNFDGQEKEMKCGLLMWIERIEVRHPGAVA
ncbi:hypothetical protein O9G_001659 [Rozella allomycis CSF55]|uniref:Uncharacterized protein n=1 Tax=Rozella allomycis (strain CSF55) TaxID=988480 RepID=A0A075AXQ3_ROZAC|nr:hypothetical protein O9G_001659 [Rozella allomycis CSF55]|eukprot:EPZ34929.1 hypothetical protein O9G_001659 [Rozella allomycis CSF55]